MPHLQSLNPQYAQLQNHGRQPSVNLVQGNIFSTNSVDWFPDISVNQHVTLDLENLTVLEPYLGDDHLHVGVGKGFFISKIGHTKLHTPQRTFTLSIVLHVPHIQKRLLSVQKSCLDNNVYFEFHLFVFYIKDFNIKTLLFSGQNKNGLYILSKTSTTFIPQAHQSPHISASVDL